VGAEWGRPVLLSGPEITPGIFFEIFDAKSRVWGQFGPENKLIEGQPNEYDVICRNAVRVPPVANDTVYLPERRSGSKIFAGTAFHRVPAPLRPWLKVNIFFKRPTIYGSNFIKQHSETLTVRNQNADCSLRK